MVATYYNIEAIMKSLNNVVNILHLWCQNIISQVNLNMVYETICDVEFVT